MTRNNGRFKLISIAFTGAFILLGARVFYLQAFKKGEILSNRRAFSRLKKLRGDLRTRDGSIIASSCRGAKIFLKKNKTLSPKEQKALYKIAGLTVPEEKKRRSRILLSGFLSPELERRMKTLPFSEKFVFIPAQKRDYFDRKYFAPIAGFTNYENNGAGGAEYEYNDYLEGDSGEIIETDATGKLILSNDPDVLHAKGNDVYLTLDYNLQSLLYDEIGRTVEKYKAKGGYGVIMVPRTGEILAAVFAGAGEESSFLKNPLIADSFEPGSTFKIVTVSAALENKLVTPDDKFFCENGSFEFAGITIRDHEPYGWLSVKDIIRYSSNIGASKLADLTGKNELYRTARAFGFGCRTGVKLPGETRGQLKRVKNWEKNSLYYISFGQEVGATPLQIAQSFAVIADGGVLVQPRILELVKNARGKIIKKAKTVRIRRVLSEKTAGTVKEMLYNVMESGTGERAKIPGWKICGKTGTAQKYDSALRAYSEEKFFSSLGGFFPKDDPQFVVFIGIDEPQGNHYGGTVCSPAFKNIIKKIIDYYGVPPDVPPETAAGLGGEKNET